VDIVRPSNTRQKQRRRIMYGVIAIVIVGVITLTLSKLKAAAPPVERGNVVIDTVKRGPMVRDVRAQGTLVPEDIRWIPATTVGRVEHIRLRPGSVVTADSVILELTNPQVEQELHDAQLKLGGAEASLVNLRVQSKNDALAQEAATANIEAEYKRAALQVEANEQLSKKGLVSDMILKQATLDADQLSARYTIAKKQLASYAESTQARVAVSQSEVDQAHAVVRLKQRQADDLHVRAGFSGVLQVVPVEVGQQVAPGANLARVADPSRLKAELKVPETQAKDIQLGQIASIDTRNGVVSGKVVRVDPSVQNGTVTVDVAMDEALPKGARPDLSVDGTIELQRLSDVVFIGRPALGQEQGAVGLFKVQADGSAVRIQVKLGVSSVTSAQVLAGLTVGDRVILSDMSAWDAFDRIKLQ
jgi:HlyD family secretion protein